MKAVAELALKNRFNAIGLVIVTAAVPITCWISAALVGLITLRKGQNQGSLFLILGLIGSIAGFTQTDFVLGMLIIPVVFLLALTLRSTNNWAWTFLAGSTIGIIGLVISTQFMQDLYVQYLDFIALEFGRNRALEPEMVSLFDGLKQALPFLFPTAVVDVALLCLFLARSWQAGLFNPGGFRKEFHAIRLQPNMVIMLLVTGAALASWNWLALEPVLMPLLFSGIALAHGVVKKKDMGTPWLTGLYIGVLFLPQIVVSLVVIAAIADAWLDIRNRVEAVEE